MINLDENLLLEIYHYLHLTRALEDQIFYLYQNQNPTKPLLIGKGYLSTGQEAISVGAAMTLEKEDWVAPSHRDMGVHLVRGMKPEEIFAQYFCRATGPTRGRDGNVHFGSADRNIIGFVSHMGAALPVANGVAWRFKYRDEKNVILSFFGDGASNQGCVHEAMNYAAVFKLPIVFICNNNGWAISTPISQQLAIENISERAKGYGFEGVITDGNDALQVYQTVKQAVDKARLGEGPTLIECKTMRMSGHGTYDPANYIPQEEKDTWKKRDPLSILRKQLEDKKIWDVEKEKSLRKEVDKEIQAAISWAANQPIPNPEGLLEGVYS